MADAVTGRKPRPGEVKRPARGAAVGRGGGSRCAPGFGSCTLYLLSWGVEARLTKNPVQVALNIGAFIKMIQKCFLV